MRGLPKSAAWPCIAVLAAAWAPAVDCAPSKEPAGVMTDAAEIRSVFPHLFRGDPGENPALKSFATRFAPARAQATPSNRCEAATSGLCYDPADRHLVFRPARRYMPTIDGLSAESVSVRRNVIRFKYSFP